MLKEYWEKIVIGRQNNYIEENKMKVNEKFYDGYFNEIIKLIRPEKEGWTGLAYYYHLYTGWYEKDNWLIPDILKAYKQLVNIDVDRLETGEEKKVLIEKAF